MAEAGFGCIWGDCTSQPLHLITDLSNGSTVSLCDEHYAPGLIPLLAAQLGVDPTHFYAHVEKYIKAQNAKAEKELADAQAATAVKGSENPATSPDGDQGQADGGPGTVPAGTAAPVPETSDAG